MKRKLSALLAIVLVAVMVFPSAIFVGAAVEDAANMIATVSGSINSDGTLADPVPFKFVDKLVEEGFTLALDDEADISIQLETTLYENLKVTQTNNSGVVSLSGSGMSYKVKTGTAYSWGASQNTDVITFTADKIGKDAEGKKTTTPTTLMKLTVTVVPKEIIDMKVYGKNTEAGFDGELIGKEQFNSAQTLTVTKIAKIYNNDHKWKEEPANANDLKLWVNNAKKTGADKVREITGLSIVLEGDDDELIYTYTDAAGIVYDSKTEDDTIELSVTSTGVIDVEPVRVKGEFINKIEDMTEDGFLNRLSVKVRYYELNVPVYYEKDQSTNNGTGVDFTVKYFEDSEYKTEIKNFADILKTKAKDAYYVIYVEDKTFESANKPLDTIQDYFDLKAKIPEDVSINWDKAINKTYDEDYRIGTNEKDWAGVEVTVYYDDGSKETFKTIEGIVGLNLILSPTKANQKFVTIEECMGEEIGTATNLPTGFEIRYREVVGITLPQTTLTYTEGETLDLSGIKATLKYNFGKNGERAITNDEFTCSPKNGATLKVGDDKVLVVYKDPITGDEFSGTIPLKVNAKPAEGTTLKSIKLLSSVSGKREYFIGESFEKEGYYLLIVMSNGETAEIELSHAGVKDFTVKSSCYDNTADAFKSSFDGDLKVTVDIKGTLKGQAISADNEEITIPGIKVTKRPVLESISVSTSKLEYMEGEAPQVKDFVITAKYDDNSQRVFEVDEDLTGATKSTFSTTKDGVYYTLKLTPTSVNGDTEVIKVSYSEQISGSKTVTKTAEVEIEVTIPDAILTYYDVEDRTYVTEAFEDFYEALEKAEDVADNYTSYYANRVPEIQLRRDVVMATDFPTTETIDIDLNGHSLTMIRGEVYVASNAASDIEVIFSNTAKEEGKLIYSSDDDDTVLIAYNDTFIIDKSSNTNGKYEVVISSVKNGKVTGPDEVTHGHDAQFTITPDEDYQIASIKVNNKTQSIPEDGKLVVKDVQAKLTVTVTFSEKAWDNPFSDVSKYATYYKSIQFVYENGLFSGMSATKFEPDTTMTRAMFVTVLGRLAGIDADEAASRYGTTSTFTDVSSSDASISYAVPYIKWASDNGLIEGYGNGKFGPKDNITHAQMYVLMQRYAAFIERQNTNVSIITIPANDVKDIPEWANDAVKYAAKNDFLITSSNRLTPNGNAKRSELAMLLEKFCVNVMGWED